jgi:hypothetical protein
MPKEKPTAKAAARSLEVEARLPASLVLWKPKFRAEGCPNPLAFAMQHQLQTRWCWSATAVSVSLYYHPASGWTQCKLANSALGQSTCCSNGASSACNKDWYLDNALQIVGSLSTWNSGKATLGTVQAEITNCRPFCLRIGWTGGGGHFVAIYGFSGSNLNVGDPWYGNSIVNYATFPGGYRGGGSWTHNYFTKA